MKTLIIILSILLLSSCSIMNNLTTEQLSHRNKIDYEIDKLWTEYEYKRDSLIIEYYKH